MIEIAYTLIALLFLSYVLLASVGFGSSIFVLFPWLLSDDALLASYVNPVLETVNIFLVFLGASIAAFFPGSDAAFGHSLAKLFLAIFILIAVRVLCVLFIYLRQKSGMFSRLLLFLSSFAALILFSQIAVFVWTGSLSPTMLSLAAALFAIGTALALSAAFFHHVGRRHSLHLEIYAIICNIFWVFSLANLFWALGSIGHLLDSPDKASFAEIAIAFGLVLAVSLWHWSPFWEFIGSCALAAVIILSFFYLQFPYLVFPSVTASSAFAGPALFGLILAAFFLGMAFAVPGVALLLSLFVGRRQKKSGREQH
jgi:cytochrome bd-type quinol oxidase subunit 2